MRIVKGLSEKEAVDIINSYIKLTKDNKLVWKRKPNVTINGINTTRYTTTYKNISLSLHYKKWDNLFLGSIYLDTFDDICDIDSSQMCYTLIDFDDIYPELIKVFRELENLITNYLKIKEEKQIQYIINDLQTDVEKIKNGTGTSNNA